MAAKRPRGVDGIKGFKQNLFESNGIKKFHDSIVRSGLSTFTQPFPPEGSDRVAALKDRLMRPMTHDEASYGDDVIPASLWEPFTGSTATTAAGVPVHGTRAGQVPDPLRDDVIKRCDALVQSFYEWNHTQFVKKPMKETLIMMQRVTRDAVPRLTEFEALQRQLDRHVQKTVAATTIPVTGATKSDTDGGHAKHRADAIDNSTELRPELLDEIASRYAAVAGANNVGDAIEEEVDETLLADEWMARQAVGDGVGVGGYVMDQDVDDAGVGHIAEGNNGAASLNDVQQEAVLADDDARDEEDRFTRRRRLEMIERPIAPQQDPTQLV